MHGDDPRRPDEERAGVRVEVAVAGQLAFELDDATAVHVGLALGDVAAQALDGREDAHPVARRARDLAVALARGADVVVLHAPTAGRAIGPRAELEARPAAEPRAARARALVARSVLRLAPRRRPVVLRVKQLGGVLVAGPAAEETRHT